MKSRLRSTLLAFSCLCPVVTGCDDGQVLGSSSSGGDAGSETAGTGNHAGSAGELRGGSNAGGAASGGATSGGRAGAGNAGVGNAGVGNAGAGAGAGGTGGSGGSTPTAGESGSPSGGSGDSGGSGGSSAGTGGTDDDGGAAGAAGAGGCPETCWVVPADMNEDRCATTEVFWRCPVTGENAEIPIFYRGCSMPPDAPPLPAPAEFCCAPTFYAGCF